MERAVTKSRHTIEDYLRLDPTSEEKHEFRDGQIVAMSGGSLNHSLIIANVIRAIGNRLLGGPCRVFDSNLRIRIARKVRYSYPDVSVICGQPQFDADDPSQTTIINPRVIVEVLSPSTEIFDRGEKFRRYLQIESLETYTLVSQDEPRVETFSRQGGGAWLFLPFSSLNRAASLDSLNIQLPLSEVYAGVEFPASSNSELDA